MTGLARRDLLKATAGAGAVALPIAARNGQFRNPLVVFDSRLAEARGFVRTVPGSAGIDLAEADRTRWAAIRFDVPHGHPVEGLTRWSDWVAVRGELEAKGLRLAHETLISRPRMDLVRWGMVPR